MTRQANNLKSLYPITTWLCKGIIMVIIALTYQSKCDENKLYNVSIGHTDHLAYHGIGNSDTSWCNYSNCKVKVNYYTQAGPCENKNNLSIKHNWFNSQNKLKMESLHIKCFNCPLCKVLNIILHHSGNL
jgi:hypothetical protein